MRDRPILFSAAMVRAILDGEKTQTRRVVKQRGLDVPACPYGNIGDRLWVREAWHHEPGQVLIRYRATGDALHPLKRWKPSIFMPRWASRITLEVVGVHTEFLQSISPGDAAAEGVQRVGHDTEPGMPSRVAAFKNLWDSLNSKRGLGWNENPLVWVIKFRVVNQQQQALELARHNARGG